MQKYFTAFTPNKIKVAYVILNNILEQRARTDKLTKQRVNN